MAVPGRLASDCGGRNYPVMDNRRQLARAKPVDGSLQGGIRGKVAQLGVKLGVPRPVGGYVRGGH